MTEDKALFDALAEYDRLIAVESDLKRRADAFRPGTPEANDASEAYTTACDEAMESWERVRKNPATTQAGRPPAGTRSAKPYCSPRPAPPRCWEPGTAPPGPLPGLRPP